MFCSSGLNLVILAWTGDKLSRGQASDCRTHRHTDRQTEATTIPEGQNWPRVRITPFWDCEFVHVISHHWLKDFQIWTKMHLSTVRIPIDFGIDWPRSSVVFLISNQLFFCKLHVSYSFASFCIYLVMTSPLWCFALRLLAVCMVRGNLNTT